MCTLAIGAAPISFGLGGMLGGSQILSTQIATREAGDTSGGMQQCSSPPAATMHAA